MLDTRCRINHLVDFLDRRQKQKVNGWVSEREQQSVLYVKNVDRVFKKKKKHWEKRYKTQPEYTAKQQKVAHHHK